MLTYQSFVDMWAEQDRQREVARYYLHLAWYDLCIATSNDWTWQPC